MKKNFNSKPFRNFLRNGSIFTATLLLVIITSSFTIPKKSNVISEQKTTTKKTLVSQSSITHMGTMGSNAQISYKLLLVGSPVAGGQGSLCPGLTTYISSDSDEMQLFDPVSNTWTSVFRQIQPG